MTPQERPVAWRPKFGERVEGIYASQTNPQRIGMFVRSGRVPHGRTNAGPWWELTDGEGNFWRYPPESCRPAEPQERPVAGDGLDREAIERRAEAATPGPWEWDDLDGDPGLVSRSVVDKEYGEFGAVLAAWPRFVVMGYPTKNGSGFPALDGPDAEFIARARDDVPALLAALKAAEAEVERLRGVLAESIPRAEAYELLRFRSPHDRTEGGAS